MARWLIMQKAATGNSPDNVLFDTPVELLTIGHMGG